MADKNVYELLNEAIELWVEISGVDPEQKSFVISLGGGFDKLALKKAHEEIRDSIKLDETGLVSCMLIQGFIDEYQKDKTVSMDFVMSEPEKFALELAKFKRLQSILKDPVIVESQAVFKEKIAEASKHYDYDVEKIAELFEDSWSIGYSLFFALKAPQELVKHQFSTGKYDKDLPNFYNGILKFPHVHMAVQFAASHEGSMISLALIRDELEDDYSYFCFLCKNGENIYILTDDDDWAHPKQKEMMRSRGRTERHIGRRRTFASFFPYQLMDRFDDENVDPDKGKGSLLSQIKDLPTYQALWLIIVFDQIHTKMWKNPKRLAEVTYFMGDVGITDGGKLLDATTEADARAAEESNLPVPVKPISLEIIKKDDLTAEKLKDEWKTKPTRQYEWIEDRYRDKVPEFAINPDRKLLAAYREQYQLTEGDEHSFPSKNPDGKTYEGSKGMVAFWNWDKKMHGLLGYAIGDTINTSAMHWCPELSSINTKTFGTIEKLKKDQKWHARHNQASMIRYYAQLEYEERKEEIFEWWKKETLKQQKRLIELAVRGELLAPIPNHRDYQFGAKNDGTMRNIIRQETSKKIPSFFGNKVSYLGDVNWYDEKFYCPITNSVATLFVYFIPETVEALAAVLNCEVKDLPDILQHWWIGEEYSGNHILDYVDPMEWVLDDPWKDMRFAVVIPFSRRGFKKVRKDLGLPPVDFNEWNDRKVY